MTKIIREILVLPLRILLLVTRFFPVVDQYTLVKWIWKIARDANAGNQLISMIEQKEGIDAARIFARQVLEETKSAETAQVIGLIEYKSYDCQKVREWVELAEELECKDQHFLLILKIFCSSYFDDYDEDEIREQMLACNYLPVWMSRYVLLAKGHCYLEKKLWKEAEGVADHLLSVNEDSFARIIKWVVCMQRGNRQQAEKNLAKSKGNAPDNYYFLQIGEAYLFLDMEDQAVEWLYKAVKGGLQWPMKKESLVGNFLKSSKFTDYCATRE